MPRCGDYYEVEIKEAHLDWGEYRHTESRPRIYGEGYIKIPLKAAKELEIYNSNKEGDKLGRNIFNWTSSDGLYSGKLKAQGSSHAGDMYAKQFAENGDLKKIGKWYEYCNANIGDSVKVEWVSEIEIRITYIRRA